MIHQAHEQNPLSLLTDASFRALVIVLLKCTEIPTSVRVLAVDGFVAHCRNLMSPMTQATQHSLIHDNVTEFVGRHGTKTAPVTSVTLCGTRNCCRIVGFSTPGREAIVPGSNTLSGMVHPLTVCGKCSMPQDVFHEYRYGINMYAGLTRQPITNHTLDATREALVLTRNPHLYVWVTVDNPEKRHGESGDFDVFIEHPYDTWVRVGTPLYDNKHRVWVVVYATSGDTAIPSKRHGVVLRVRARLDSADPKPSEEIAGWRYEIEEKEIAKRTKSSAGSAGAASAAGSAGSAGSTSAMVESGSGKMPGPRELRKMSNDRKRAAIKQEPRDDAYDSDATTPFFEGSDDDDNKITLSKGKGKSKRARK